MVNSTTLYDLIVQSAVAALSSQNGETGRMPAGHNGPYHDPETPVRNTSHWLITFVKAYDISGEKCFLTAARRAASYLLSKDACPMGATFWHRKNPNKDACNGLIGQAWTIEALAVAVEPLDMPELGELAARVFLLHPFDERIGLWRRVAVDGTYLSPDMTFNHQLWFSAAGGLLAEHGGAEIEARVRRFMDCVQDQVNIYPSGLICPPLALRRSWRQRLARFRRRVRQSGCERRRLAYKAVGYHAFNLYAFALLREHFPDHAFWHSSKFCGIWSYARSQAYRRTLADNKYGYPYNPAGFEMAFALGVFGDNTGSEQEWWVCQQFHRCYDFDAHLMSRGTEDPMTLAARLYEATRLPDLTVRIQG